MGDPRVRLTGGALGPDLCMWGPAESAWNLISVSGLGRGCAAQDPILPIWPTDQPCATHVVYRAKKVKHH